MYIFLILFIFIKHTHTHTLFYYCSVCVNSFTRSRCQNWRVCSAAATSVASNKTDPTWNENLNLISMGEGKLVFNLMSRQTLAADAFLGQAVLDFGKYKQIKPDTTHEICLPLKSMKVPLYDTKGQPINVNTDSPSINSTINVLIHVPKYYSNVCGFFYDIKTNIIGDVYGEKVWVEVDMQHFYVFPNPFDKVHILKLACTDITEIEEIIIHDIEMPMEGLRIKLNDGSEKRFAWGADELGIRGLWRHALLRHSYIHVNTNIPFN